VNVWIAIFAVGAGSYVFRAVPLFVPWVATPPPAVERVLTRSGNASLAALAAASARHQTTGVGTGAQLAVVAALCIGLAAARRGAPMHLVVVAGVFGHLVVGALVTNVG
jgi:branched-subunit amino acid transport protein